MKIVVYSMKQYDKKYLQYVNDVYGFELEFFDFLLIVKIVKIVNGCEVVCIFVNDDGSCLVLEELKVYGVKYIVLCCVGFNNVDFEVVKEFGLCVVCVLVYFLEVVVEYVIGMMMLFNCCIYCVYQCICDVNFFFEGFIGFIMYGKIVGVIGIGKIGVVMLWIFKGFGMCLLVFDLYLSVVVLELGVEYVDFVMLYKELDVIFLYCLLIDENYYFFNCEVFDQMKDGVMVINISCGVLIDFQVVIDVLKYQKIGVLGLDVYENECDLFFEDKFNDVIQDDVFCCFFVCYNVLFIGYQVFFIVEVLISILEIILGNLQQVVNGEICLNVIV